MQKVRSWIPREDAILRSKKAAGVTWRVIAAGLHRNYDCCRRRFYKIGDGRKSAPAFLLGSIDKEHALRLASAQRELAILRSYDG